MNLLKAKVSHQVNAWSTIGDELSIENILKQIKSDKYKRQIEDLRNQLEKENLEYYDSNKKRLPAVTFSATFNTTRAKINLRIYNPIIVIDIDKLNEKQIKKTHDHLLNDACVYSFWRSPSNKGFKGLVFLEFNFDKVEIDLDTLHKSAFKKLAKYFKESYNIELDKSGSDITRLCFLSYDPGLSIKANYNRFILNSEDIVFPIKNTHIINNKTINITSNSDALHNPFKKTYHRTGQ